MLNLFQHPPFCYLRFNITNNEIGRHAELVSASAPTLKNNPINMLKNGYVYIMTNSNLTTFYIGVTNDLKRRVIEHKEGIGSGFTSKYNLIVLVYYEQVFSMDAAIKREKQLKNWHKAWKINLIKEHNPFMKDLFDEL